MRKKLLIVNGLAAAAAAVALVVTAPGAEAAVIPIGGVAVPFTVTAPVTTYSVTASSGRWSVVGIGGNVDRMTLRRPFVLNGASLRSVAHDGDFYSRWIAMDNRPGRRPAGLYHVTVTSQVNDWNQLQFLDGGPELVSGQTFSSEILAGHWVVDLREVRLNRGDRLTLRTSGASLRAINIMHSPAVFGSNFTYSRINTDRTFLIEKPMSEEEVDTVEFRASQTGDYAVVFENGWYGRTATVTPTITRVAIP